MARRSPGKLQLFGHWRTIPAWVKDLAHVGYTAKALIYFFIGGVGLYEALRRQSAHSSPGHAMHLLRLQPLGTLALALLAVGMCCYGAHRCIEAFWGPVGTKSLLLEASHRTGRLCGGCAYLGFAALAIDYVISNHSGNSSGPYLAGKVMSYPLGNTLITIIGLCIFGAGIRFFYDALSGRYRKSYKLSKKHSYFAWIVSGGAVFGICSRALFFCLCGALTILSAIHSDPSRASGMQGVLKTIQKAPLGEWFYGLIAIGFMTYGLFCFLRAICGNYPVDAGT